MYSLEEIIGSLGTSADVRRKKRRASRSNPFAKFFDYQVERPYDATPFDGFAGQFGTPRPAPTGGGSSGGSTTGGEADNPSGGSGYVGGGGIGVDNNHGATSSNRGLGTSSNEALGRDVLSFLSNLRGF